MRQSPDGGAEVEIADTGCGMEPEVLSHATEPFFTARADGSGTGLGLSMVDGFVHQSGGEMALASIPGAGTTVTLRFPPLPVEPEYAALHGHALVVDDDATYLEAAATALEGFGLSVTRAASYDAGLAAIRTLPQLDLLLTDLNLDRGTSGWELAQAVEAARPEALILVMSTRRLDSPPPGLHAATLAKPLNGPELRRLLAPLSAPHPL
ncbi:ATP-binding protein [Arenibacterium sp. LLYu02]|uniref:ATP-binding protein n=1 Tax=Arenibacterium sp. LLYu02 TaxID=3404132 RepID=UPI003B226D76